MPAKSSLFCGRAAEIRFIINFLTQKPEDGSKRGRLCILGTGGIGKTSLAFEVMHNEEIKECFTKLGLIWGPCAQALSPELLLDTLYNALAISHDTHNTLQDILDNLCSSGPVLLLLDNFETPWNAEGSRADIARILLDIEQLPNVALLITMRATDGPCEEISWEEMRIQPLDAQASCQLYTKIYPKSKDDHDLPDLLDLLGHMPLAVKLMAQQAKSTGRTAAQLMKTYHKVGTGMLGPSRGSDAQNSMDISIIQNEPDARSLLICIAILLGGTTYDALEEWWAPGFPNLHRALQALLETSLVEHRTSTFFVLPVIRSHVLDPSRCPQDIHQSMVQGACRFLEKHNSVTPGEPEYKDHTAARSAEEINLQTILLNTAIPETDILQALLTLARHQTRTRPRVEVIQHTLQLAGQTSLPQILADSLDCYREILYCLGSFNESLNQSTLARERYLEVPDIRNAARALLDAVFTSSQIDDNPDTIPMIQQACQEYESIADEQGVALCLLRLGGAHLDQYNYAEAIPPLKQARTMFPGLCIDSTECAAFLAQAYRQLGQYDEAESWALTAYEENKQLGSLVSYSLRILGRILILKGDYDKAIHYLTEALEASTAQGNVMGCGLSHLELGRAWMKKGANDEANTWFKEASKELSTVQGSNTTNSLIICSFYLQKLADPAVIPTLKEAKALQYTLHEEDIPYVVNQK
ncbi:P-loop containing nucleoside triphosphate hydrolase protein [Mycena floridula]|nr:P-loop containing nucleoside triphosphate hydrolase protein [Mycena floridula]